MVTLRNCTLLWQLFDQRSKYEQQCVFNSPLNWIHIAAQILISDQRVAIKPNLYSSPNVIKILNSIIEAQSYASCVFFKNAILRFSGNTMATFLILPKILFMQILLKFFIYNEYYLVDFEENTSNIKIFLEKVSLSSSLSFRQGVDLATFSCFQKNFDLDFTSAQKDCGFAKRVCEVTWHWWQQTVQSWIKDVKDFVNFISRFCLRQFCLRFWIKVISWRFEVLKCSKKCALIVSKSAKRGNSVVFP